MLNSLLCFIFSLLHKIRTSAKQNQQQKHRQEAYVYLGGIPGSRFCENSELFNPENRQTPRFPFQKERERNLLVSCHGNLRCETNLVASRLVPTF